MRRFTYALLGGFLLIYAFQGIHALAGISTAISSIASARHAGIPSTADSVVVTSCGPRGNLRGAGDARTLHVTFSRPMVPVELPSATTRGPFLVEPPLPGSYRWSGTQTLTFVADTLPRLSTTYRVTVPAGLRSLDSSPLLETFTFSFTTPRIRVVRLDAGPDAFDLAPDQPLVLLFTQSVSPSAVKSSTRIEARDARRPVRFLARRPRAAELNQGLMEIPIDRLVAIEPTGAWPQASALSVTILPGLASAEGELGMTDTFAWQGRTCGPLALHGLGDSPARHPYDFIRLHFSSRVKPRELLRRVTFEPPVGRISPEALLSTPARDIYLPVAFRPGCTYVVRIDRRLKSIHGRALSGTDSLVFTTRDYPASFSLMSGQVVLRDDREPRLHVTTTNVETLALRMAKVTAEEFLGTREFSWQVDRPWRVAGTRNESMRHRIPIDELTGGKRSGFYRVEIAAIEDTTWRNPRSLFIQLTTLGVTAKFSPESTIAWVTRLSDASPVEGAEVRILDTNGRMLWQGRSGRQGFVHAPGWTSWDVPADPEDWWGAPDLRIVANFEGATAAITTQWNEGIEAWRFPVSHIPGGRGRAARGVVFSDRNLYRPGETVHLKGLMRLADGRGLSRPDSDRVFVKVTGPQGDELKTEVRPLAGGAFDLDVALPPAATPGYYEVRAVPGTSAPRDENWWSEEAAAVEGSFRVSEFRPTRLSATVSLGGSRLRFGGRAPVSVTGRSLAGSALSNRALRLTAHLSVAPPTPEDFASFSFDPREGSYTWSDEENPASSEELLADRSSRLDGSGTWNQPLRIPSDFPRAMRGMNPHGRPLTDGLLSVEATVTDLSNQSVSARASRLVERGSFLAGIRAEECFVPVNRATRLLGIALDRSERPAPGREIRFTVVRRSWENRRNRTVGGGVWVSRPVDRVVATGTVLSDSRPVPFSFTPEKGGYYIAFAEVEDDRGRVMRGACGFYSWGGDASWWRGNDDRVELMPERASYKPGETARILVRSPFAHARAWVTVEREGVISSRLVDFTDPAPLIEVPIREEHVPNVHVAVTLIHAGSGPVEGTPVRIGLVGLKVDPRGRRVEPEIVCDRPEYRPGDTVTMRVRVKGAGRVSPADLTIAVADEGVISLTGYRFPDPIPVFFEPHPHRVTTAELRTHLVDGRTLGEKGEEAGGGGGESGRNDAWMRRDFKPLAAWFSRVRTDENGLATVSFRLPDAITTWRVLVLAADDAERFGRSDMTFLSRRPLVLEPALPRVVRAGDTVEAGVLVRNLSRSPGVVEVTCEANGVVFDGLRASSGSARRVRLGAESDTVVSWRFALAPSAAIDSIVFRFTGRLSGGPGEEISRDAIENALPVARERAEDLAAVSGDLVGAEHRETVRVPSDAAPSAGGLSVRLSSTAFVQLSGAADYLFSYPYGCLEQRTSAVLPVIEFGDIASRFGLKSLPGGREEAKRIVEEYLRGLAGFQCADGGFCLWKGGDHSYPYLTAIVVDAVVRARQAGYAVDDAVLSKATSYLARQVRDRRAASGLPYDLRAAWASDARALEALARAGLVKTADLEPSFRERERLPLIGLASLYRAAALANADAALRADLRRLMMNGLRIASNTAHFEESDERGLGWVYHTNATATAECLRAILESGDDFPEAPKVARWLVRERRNGRWRSTRENAAVFSALGAYFRRYEAAEPDLSASALLAGLPLVERRFSGRTTDVAEGTMPMAGLAARHAGDAVPVVIASRGAGRLYYEIRLAGTRTSDTAARDLGFAVERSLETLDGRPADPRRLRCGETYRLVTVVTTVQDRLFAAVESPLPAGLEAVDLSLATERQDLGRFAGRSGSPWWSGFQRTELRDDRVRFFADALPAGRYRLVALVRATVAGDFAWPAARCEAMYEPEVYGRTSPERAKVSAR